MTYVETAFDYPTVAQFDEEAARVVNVEDAQLGVLLYLLVSYIYKKDNIECMTRERFYSLCGFLEDHISQLPDNSAKLIKKEDLAKRVCTLVIPRSKGEYYVKGKEMPPDLDKKAFRYLHSFNFGSKAESWETIEASTD
jgi:hypothetical protein